MHRVLFAAALVVGLVWGQEFKLGERVGDFSLTDTAGQSVPYESLKGDVTVIMFIATKCPVSNNYNERMKALYSDYASKGVKFVFVNSNGTEPAAEVQNHAQQNGFSFAVYKDQGNVVADRFGAQVTPEAFIIDKAGVIQYHGYIDDAQNVAKVQNHGLRKALDAMLAGQAVPVKETKAFGCTIKRAK